MRLGLGRFFTNFYVHGCDFRFSFPVWFCSVVGVVLFFCCDIFVCFFFKFESKTGFEGVRLCLGRFFSNFYLHVCDFSFLFSNLVLFCCWGCFVFSFNVFVFGLVSVCMCVSLFRCFFFFGALFTNFYIVHGCDFIVFLWLTSFFWGLLFLRCWV